jgi:hypothetical protein
VFDCAESNPGIVVMARRMSILVSRAGRTPPLLVRQAPRVEILFVLGRTWEWEWEWYGAKRKAEEVANDFFVRTLGLQRELERTTKNTLSGFARRE